MFVGRKQELSELNNRYNSIKKEFGVIYGRRRIGKSYLIKEFIKDKKYLLYQAKEDSLYGNLKSLSYEINKFLNLPNSFVFNSYEDAFYSIEDKVKYLSLTSTYPYYLSALDFSISFDENLMKLDTYKFHFYSLDDLFKFDS